MTATHRRQYQRDPRLGGRPDIWYPLVIFTSIGFLSWMPFVHAAIRLRSAARAVEAASYALVASTSFYLLGAAPYDGTGDPVDGGGIEITVAMLLLFGLIIVTFTRQQVLRRTPPRDPAITAVLEARSKRDRAREIAARDPLLAHDLHIGRPDHHARRYDDGGLVDLNSARVETIAVTCELPLSVAQAVVDARPAGGFLTVDDVFVAVDVPVHRWPLIRDRAAVITF